MFARDCFVARGFVGYIGAQRMLKREGSIGGADTDAPIPPAARRDDSFEWETPARSGAVIATT